MIPARVLAFPIAHTSFSGSLDMWHFPIENISGGLRVGTTRRECAWGSQGRPIHMFWAKDDQNATSRREDD